MNPLKILKSIIEEFSGIDKGDLQTAELNICTLLVDKGWAKWRSPIVSAGENREFDYHEERISSELPDFQEVFVILSDCDDENGMLLGIHHSFNAAANTLVDLTSSKHSIQRTNEQMRIETIDMGEYHSDGF